MHNQVKKLKILTVSPYVDGTVEINVDGIIEVKVGGIVETGPSNKRLHFFLLTLSWICSVYTVWFERSMGNTVKRNIQKFRY